MLPPRARPNRCRTKSPARDVRSRSDERKAVTCRANRRAADRPERREPGRRRLVDVLVNTCKCLVNEPEPGGPEQPLGNRKSPTARSCGSSSRAGRKTLGPGSARSRDQTMGPAHAVRPDGQGVYRCCGPACALRPVPRDCLGGQTEPQRCEGRSAGSCPRSPRAGPRGCARCSAGLGSKSWFFEMTRATPKASRHSGLDHGCARTRTRHGHVVNTFYATVLGTALWVDDPTAPLPDQEASGRGAAIGY